MSYKLHLNCRACGYGPPLNAPDIKSDSKDSLVSVLDLGVMPLANAFKKQGQSRPGHYPVHLLACPRCHLGQLSAVVDPAVMYADYPYVTSPSVTMRAHFDALWDFLSGQRPIENVVEIGSNDGLLLEHFKRRGATAVMGIDPAQNLVKEAQARGVTSICSLFDRQAANMAQAALPPIDLVLARHVFCHIHDWQEFINNVLVLCSKETIVCIEVPYAHDTIVNCEWDTVYAEHLSYLTIRSVEYLLRGSGLRLQHIARFPVHGGAIAIILRRCDSTAEENPSVNKFLDSENCDIPDWQTFGRKAVQQMMNLKELVQDLRRQGKRIVGYGASAKSTVWINACGFQRSQIESVFDYTPQKQYTVIPGTNIPVAHEGAFYATGSDYAVVWCWNFLDEILKRQQKWILGGGRFIVPVPEVKIL